MTIADVFAALDAAQAALDALTDDTPTDERTKVEAAHRAATTAVFDLL